MGLILIPSEVTSKTEGIRTILEGIAQAYQNTMMVIQNFAGDSELDTQAWNTLKSKVLDYHEIIVQGMLSAQDSMQTDAAVLEQSVGTENLYEDKLRETITRLKTSRQQCEDEIKELENLRNHFIISLFSGACSWINEAIRMLHDEIIKIDQVISVCREKLQFLENAQNSTQTLFKPAIQLLVALAAAINDAGVEITGEGKKSDINWKITIDNANAQMDQRIQAFIEEALKSELDIDLEQLKEMYGEEVVNRLINTMKTSGINRLEEGSAERYIEAAMKCLTGYEIEKINGKYIYEDSNGIKEVFTTDVAKNMLQTEAKLQQLINVAYGEVGICEEEINKVKYNNWFYCGDEILTKNQVTPSGEAYPWCAVFISWCANEVGILDTNIPKNAGCKNMKNDYILANNYYLRADGYEPKAGDVFVHLNADNTGHVGIVVAYDKENNTIYSIEGNSGDKVVVNKRQYGVYFDGFGSNGGNTYGNIPEEYEEASNKDR